MKIAMSGLISEQNFGDPIIERSAKWVYRDVCRRLGIDDVDWADADLDVEKMGGIAFYGCRVARKLNLLWLLKVFVIVLSFRYEKLLRGCRFGVISGGGLFHYKYLNCAYGVGAFVVACRRRRIPVIINPVGVEGFDEKDIKCRLLKWCVNLENVMAIMVRDDEETMQEYYLTKNRSRLLGLAYDPAVFSRKLITDSGIRKDNVVGIGLMRDGRFADFGDKDYAQEMVLFYVRVANEFDKKNVRYEFFTNGLDRDLALVSGIEKGLGRKIKIHVPKNAEELLRYIASLSGLIGFRMHSLIISYSFNVPAVAIAWHDKIKRWMSIIGCSDDMMTIDKLDALFAVNRLVYRMKLGGYNQKMRFELEKTHCDKVAEAVRRSLLAA